MSLSESLNTTDTTPTNTNTNTSDESDDKNETEVTKSADALTTKKSVAIVVDASGSMNERVDGVTKMDVVKKAINESTASMGSLESLSVWVYGSQYSSQDQDKSCKDAKEYVNVLPSASTVYEKRVEEALSGVEPLGNAPIAYTLEQIGKSFEVGSDHAIVVISDGADNCAGDPVAEAKKIISENEEATIDTVGLDVDTKGEAALEALALAGNGTYTPAKDSTDIANVLIEASGTQQTKGTTSGELVTVAGGDSFDDAKVFSKDYFDTDLTLDKNLPANTYEYWKLVLTPGQGVKISVTTGDKDVQFQDNEAKETNDAPSAGVSVFDDEEAKLFDVGVQQKKNATESGEVWEVSADDETHVFYISVGYWLPVHKDMHFSVELLEEYDDALGKGDAPNSLREKLEALKTGGYVGYLSGNDTLDYYALDLSEGQTAIVTLTPTENDGDFALELYDSKRAVVLAKRVETPGKPVTLTYEVPVTDMYALGVLSGEGKYALDVDIAGEAKTDEVVGTVQPVIDSSEQDLINVQGTETSPLFAQTWFLVALIVGIPVLIFIVVLVIAIMVIMKRRKKMGKTTGGVGPQGDKKEPPKPEAPQGGITSPKVPGGDIS